MYGNEEAMANDWNDSAEDRVSFDDSDQFDEDSMSLCSWLSENEIVGGITWRGWRKNAASISPAVPEDEVRFYFDKIYCIPEISE